ncbi:dihydroorotase [Nostoc sp. CCY0012]|uniref:dihydroorotase n=1 Tax=Nostoc sp. CCY0012 TaxID=1056123 RepID=UPI0039C5DA2B
MIELLQKIRVIDPTSGTDKIADVLIADGKIQAIAPQISDISSQTQIKDCQGLVLGTGLVDLYSHSGEPGFEERETLLSLLQAAAAGGFTRVSILPDTSPTIDHPALIAKLQKQRDQEHTHAVSPIPHLHIWGAITLDLAGKQLTELAELAAAGVVGFTDGKPWENLGLVRRVLEYLQPVGKPVAFWPSDRLLSANGVMREGAEALRLGLPPIPASAETTAIASLIELVAAIGTPVHIMRVSTARSVELIASAKAAGLPITASTTWMHLLLDTKAVKSYHTSLHLEPPLGNASDVRALRTGVKQGTIDAIAIDHAPHTYEEKVQAFAESLPGAIGLELALPLLWQNLVETGEFTALELWRALSTNPAKCLGQKPSAITSNQPAELTLFNPQETWKLEKKNLHTLSVNTPWLGQQLKGRVVQTWC